MDGTFRVSLLFFTQLYTLHRPFRGGIFPMIYLLLLDKNREIYEATLSLIVQAAHQLNLEFKPETFLLDFELAMMRAIRSTFPFRELKVVYYNC